MFRGFERSLNMKRILTLLLTLAILVTSGCSTFRGTKEDGSMGKIRQSSPLIKHIADSTVALVLRRPDNSVRVYCTGVWVSENIILTAHHCVQSAVNVIYGAEEVDAPVDGASIYYILENEVTSVEEEPTAVHLAQVAQDDANHDLTLVKALGNAVPKHDIAKLADVSPGVGERLHFCGHVGGLYWTFVEGVVAAYRKELPVERSGSFLQVSAPVYFGNSGGGAFNTDGELVGIASFLIKRIPNTAFYVHLTHVKKLIEEYKKP